MPCSSRLKNGRACIAASQRRRSQRGASNSDVPIAGTRVHGVTAIGSSTTGAWPRRHGAAIAGRYGAVGATSARGSVATAPDGRPSTRSPAITASLAA